MNDLGAALQQLRDIHLPPPPSIWPLAPGWWLLLIVGGLLLLAWFYWLRYSRRHAARQQVWGELYRLQQNYEQDRDVQAYAMGVSILLRRAAMVRHGRKEVAALTGDRWLAFLDRECSHKEFVNGVGACLVDAPYRRQQEVDVNSLASLVRSWMRENL